jgi:hypothetical protein
MSLSRRAKVSLASAGAAAVLALTFGAALASTTASTTDDSQSPTATESVSASPESTGPALAEQLGLRQLDRKPNGEIDAAGCETGVIAFDSGEIYCFDGQVDPNSPTLEIDKEALFRRLTGAPPLTDQQIDQVNNAETTSGDG